ncbi:MAG: hypothetical protein C9356_12275 [Oleiphilus sp.]|nr:MAG: hypothetical protein C9356_12275 [Oleiphilus sp.]
MSNDKILENAKPPVICVREFVENKDEFLRLAKLSEAQSIFLNALEGKATEASNWILDLEGIQEALTNSANDSKQQKHASSKQVIQKRIRELQQKGLVHTSQHKRLKKRSIAFYQICLSNHEEEIRSESRQFKNHKCTENRSSIKQHLESENGNIIRLKDFETQQMRSESFVTGVLDKAMRINSKDKRRTIESVVMYNKEPVVIQSMCTEGSSLMYLADQVVTRAVVTLCAMYIEKELTKPQIDLFHEQREITNRFDIDITDLCKLVHKKPCGSGRDYVRDALWRMDSTRFMIRCKPNGTFSNEILDGHDTHSFSFFKDFKAKSDKEGRNFRHDRFFRLEFNDYTYRCLTDKALRKLFVAHPDICQIRSGIVQTLYNLCRIAIGGSNNARGAKVLRYPIAKFRDSIFPMYDSTKKLWQDLNKHLKPYATDPIKWADGSRKTASVLGYEFNLIEDKEQGLCITIRRNRADKYFGDAPVKFPREFKVASA